MPVQGACARSPGEGGGGSLLILVQDLDQETRSDGQGLWAPSQRRRRNSADC